jgi:hypothetical protein
MAANTTGIRKPVAARDRGRPIHDAVVAAVSAAERDLGSADGWKLSYARGFFSPNLSELISE